MKRSLNEVTNEFRKALTGAGYPVGVAQDSAMAAACLQVAGFDSAAAVVAALPDDKQGELSACLPQLPALFECVLAGEEGVSLESVDVPMLALGTALHLARQHESAFWVELCGDGFLITPSGFSPQPNESALAGALVTLTICMGNPQSETKPPLRIKGEGVEINETLWPTVQRWAKETYVPASEQSRLAGAGAGLNDND